MKWEECQSFSMLALVHDAYMSAAVDLPPWLQDIWFSMDVITGHPWPHVACVFSHQQICLSHPK